MPATDPQAVGLATRDREISWEVATLLLDVVPAWAASASAYMLDRLPALSPDRAMVAALTDHAEANAREVLTTLRAGMDRQAHVTPAEALVHARYLHQRGVGLGVLMDAYRLAFPMFREMLAVELRERASDEAQSHRLIAAADAYAFPFIATTSNRISFEFGSVAGGWTPTADDPAMVRAETIARAHQLRSERLAAGAWIADTIDGSGAPARAAADLEHFLRTIESGVAEAGLHDRVAQAATTVTITLADEPARACTLLLDRVPIELVRGVTDGECTVSIASVDLARLWSTDFHLAMAIAKGRVAITGPVRKFLRVVPILRAAGRGYHEPIRGHDAA